jgi:hypothetical protein
VIPGDDRVDRNRFFGSFPGGGAVSTGSYLHPDVDFSADRKAMIVNGKPVIFR